MQLKKYLEEPYPYYYGNQKKLILILVLISFLSFVFSYFFDPFVVNISEHRIDYIWILGIHSLIPFPIAYLYFSYLNWKSKGDSWTLGKEILNLSIILLIIGIVDFLIRDIIYLNPDNWSLRYLWEEIRNTFLVGVLLLAIVLPINLERLIKKHSSSLKKLSLKPKESLVKDSTIHIKLGVSNDHFEIKTEHFLFAKVESNYTEIFTTSSNGFNKKLIRITLKELESQLQSFPFIYKTHRSYLVNINHIKSFSGNAQGYLINFKNYEWSIPVSRSKIKEFNLLFSSNSET
ncbi:LytR/AlgR family response regulator transcription factor [Aquimarina megaterium]|uniref:LytR/AlgR family response regulator transcription factor n=1 Tax=Aquimarina megaterium TaxID=1443666 RepID=UPI000471B251|nr:LytTR family DNA-binding domain-containing protein [Aquimarina megaterium]